MFWWKGTVSSPHSLLSEACDADDVKRHRQRERLHYIIDVYLSLRAPDVLEEAAHNLHRLVPYQPVVVLRKSRGSDFPVAFPFVAFRSDNIPSKDPKELV